jgi:hypothetical protein
MALWSIVVTLVMACNVSALPCRFVRSIPVEQICSLKVSQFALCQLYRIEVRGIAAGRAKVAVIEL